MINPTRLNTRIKKVIRICSTVAEIDDNGVSEEQNPLRSLWKYVVGSTLVASMCCLPSVVMVMFGLATVSTGAALSDTLYWGEDGFAWFRSTMLLLALLCVVCGLVFYFRDQGICTLDQVKRERRKVINTSLLVITVSYLLYLLFNYVILTELGIAVGLPWESTRESYMFWK